MYTDLLKRYFFQEIWALGKIIYFIYKIIFFSLNLTEIKKYIFVFMEIIFQEIWALGKIVYFIYKIIFFFLNLTEIKK